MGALKILPGNIANMIAAGEVVQRPASVVKELMENAVDAGSTSVTVVVTDAGRTLIQVIDNGSGMSPDDALLCFERHATSKIATAEDLEQILTYGFRGEALASIAAVAEVTLKTRRPKDEVATQVRITSFNHIETSQVSAPIGSNFAVRNLFYNTPARRKFLKSDNVELKHIVEEFSRIALTRPDIAFTLTHNGRDLYVLKPAKSLKFRAQDLLGANVLNRPEERQKLLNELDPVKRLEAICEILIRESDMADREKQIQEEIRKRRRRPLAVILVLCGLLLLAAVVFNAFPGDLGGRSRRAELVPPTPTAPVEPSLTPIPFEAFNSATPGPSVTMEPVVVPEVELPPENEHGYQVLVDDGSWSDAQRKCAALGGHLVAIDDEQELEEVIRMAEEAGISRVWIGMHRTNRDSDEYRWDGKDAGYEGYVLWARGEPTFEDEGFMEDYIMLWNHGGWAYNDNRDDPCRDYPEFYSGTMGYICEFYD